HQVLGRLVEYAAPARLGGAFRRAGDPPIDPVAASGDGGRFLPFVLHSACRSDAQRDPAAARAHAAPYAGAARRSLMRWISGRTPHTFSPLTQSPLGWPSP